MNIKQAKEEIKHAVEVYFSKDETGAYRMAPVRQRPILLMGPPGIGKTQIMEQIARECGIGLVAYTITHHTRQSAVGLPFICEEEYDGRKYSVTEYTMSEIIASIYRKQKESGIREGILFIDEINCVSETLAPTMLQFLQCKTFGNQAVPEGWMIVAAGNPPEYNKSVREFDMVTLDRVRYLKVDADLAVWQEYAKEQRIYGAILSYLSIRPRNFYRVETDVDGMKFVTARGWEDLSSILWLYEEKKLPVTEELVAEYLHHDEVAEDFFSYLELYHKYQDDYRIFEILAGQVSPELYARIERASFDERLSVVHLLLDALAEDILVYTKEKYITDAWYAFLKQYRSALDTEEQPVTCYRTMMQERENMLKQKEAGNFYTKDTLVLERKLSVLLQNYLPQNVEDKKEAARDTFAAARAGFGAQTGRLEQCELRIMERLEHAFDFMEQAFDKQQEMVVFVTGLTMDTRAVGFLAEHDCERYLQYKDSLLIGTTRAKLLDELKR